MNEPISQRDFDKYVKYLQSSPSYPPLSSNPVRTCEETVLTKTPPKKRRRRHR